MSESPSSILAIHDAAKDMLQDQVGGLLQLWIDAIAQVLVESVGGIWHEPETSPAAGRR